MAFISRCPLQCFENILFYRFRPRRLRRRVTAATEAQRKNSKERKRKEKKGQFPKVFIPHSARVQGPIGSRFLTRGPPVRTRPASVVLAPAITLVNGSLGRGSRGASHGSRAFSHGGPSPLHQRRPIAANRVASGLNDLTRSAGRGALARVGQTPNPVAMTPRL